MSMRRAAPLACVLAFSRGSVDARASEAAWSPLLPRVEVASLDAARIFEDAILPEEAPAPAVSFANWQGTSFGAILPPTALDIDASGGFDVAFHFHAAMMAEKDWRASSTNAVLVSATFGIGSGAYADAFASPARFGQMLREIGSLIEKREHSARPLHVRKVTLVAWSAGFAAVSAILAVPTYYGLVDSVVLLDGLHATYNNPKAGSAQGEAQVRKSSLATFTRFATDALAGEKTFVLTHSSIVPPGYASTTECVSALLHGVGVTPDETSPDPRERTSLRMTVDAQGLHARGYSGTSQPAHIDHLHMVGTLMKTFVVPERHQRLSAPSTNVSIASRDLAE